LFAVDCERVTGNSETISIVICRLPFLLSAVRLLAFDWSWKLSIRMVAGFAEIAEKDFLVAGACNVPNALIIPFRIELFRPVQRFAPMKCRTW